MARRSNDHHGKDKSIKYHNRVAKQYDAIYDDAYWEFHDQVTWRHIKPFIPEDLATPCLDVGCGTGKWGLKLLKSGFAVTFSDHAPAMIGKVREKLDDLGRGAQRCSTLVADIVDLRDLPDDHFGLTLAMGDPVSICSDPIRAAHELFRITKPGGAVIATVDNRLSGLSHFLERSNIDGLDDFIAKGRTHWLTRDQTEQFQTHTFTPAQARRLFESSGFEVASVLGKTVLPIRSFRHLLEDRSVLRRLVDLELQLSKDAGNAACAAHLQVHAIKPASQPTHP